MKIKESQGARRRTPREEIVAHLAWWWMGTLTPARYAKTHGIKPAVFERWIRTRLIFNPDSGGRKTPEIMAKRKEKSAVVATEFVEAVFVAEASSC